MKTDIKNREDIETVIHLFYAKVKDDPHIGHFFTKVIPVDWDKHLPIMIDFWESILFHKSTYNGNPLAKHQALDSKYPLKTDDFQHWIKMFTETIDKHFEGTNAETMKQRGISIATIMQAKIIFSN